MILSLELKSTLFLYEFERDRGCAPHKVLPSNLYICDEQEL